MKYRHPIRFLPAIISIMAIASLVSAQTDPDQLFKAIQKGDIKAVENYIKQGGDVNLTSNIGATPIIYAIWGNHEAIMKMLVGNGADPDLKTEKFGPALTVSAEMGRNETCDYLLSKGADINARNNEGKTPLMIAIYSSHPQLAKSFIAEGADVNIKGPSNWTALMFAAMRGDLEIVKNLIHANADVNAKTTDGETALQRATALNYQEIKKALKEAGAK